MVARRQRAREPRGGERCSRPGCVLHPRDVRRRRFRASGLYERRGVRDAYGSLVPRRNARRRRRRRTVTERFRNVSRSGPTGTVEPREPGRRGAGRRVRAREKRSTHSFCSHALGRPYKTLQNLKSQGAVPGRQLKLRGLMCHVTRRGEEGPTHRRAVGTRSGFRFRAVDSTPAA